MAKQGLSEGWRTVAARGVAHGGCIRGGTRWLHKGWRTVAAQGAAHGGCTKASAGGCTRDGARWLHTRGDARWLHKGWRFTIRNDDLSLRKTCCRDGSLVLFGPRCRPPRALIPVSDVIDRPNFPLLGALKPLDMVVDLVLRVKACLVPHPVRRRPRERVRLDLWIPGLPRSRPPIKVAIMARSRSPPKPPISLQSVSFPVCTKALKGVGGGFQLSRGRRSPLVCTVT
jgi:hypothetical protein